MTVTRRQFLQSSGAFAGSFAFSASGKTQSTVAQPVSGTGVSFPQGVASADPQPNAVLLWTRAEPMQTLPEVVLVVQVARDESFQTVVMERSLSTNASSDYTVRVFVDELQSDTTYFYRFIAANGGVSRTGRTWTAPANDSDRVASIAFASCQSIQVGFMGPYQHLVNLEKQEGLERSVDLVMHLGDYIYENIPPQQEPLPRYQDGRARAFPPFPSGGVQGPRTTRAANTADDYRVLYKTYLADPDLQEARARFPFVCIWDDHEFSDDSWQSFGLGRATPRRRVDAYQAWFEFVPALLSESQSVAGVSNPASDFARVEVEDAEMHPYDSNFLSTEPNNQNAMNSICVYRSIRWGKNLDIMLTDLRSYRSPAADLTHSMGSLLGEEEAPEQHGWGLSTEVREILAAGRTFNNGNPPRTIDVNGVSIPNPRFDAPPVTQMGANQKQWFKDALADSDAAWKLWGNPIPLMNFSIDYSVLGEGYSDSVMWPGDSWDAFPNERRELMQFVRDEGVRNLMSFSGDRHLHAAGLVAAEREPEDYVMPDFACSSISMVTRVEIQMNEWRQADPAVRQLNTFRSSGPDGEIQVNPNMNIAVRHGVAAATAMAHSQDLEQANQRSSPDLNPHIDFFDGYSHGYGIGRFTSDSASVTLYGFDVQTRQQHWGADGPPEAYRIQYLLDSWADTGTPTLKRVGFHGQKVLGDN